MNDDGDEHAKNRVTAVNLDKNDRLVTPARTPHRESSARYPVHNFQTTLCQPAEYR